MGGVSCRLRRLACSHIFEYCGKNVNIEKGAWFGRGSRLRLGDYSGLGVNCVIPDGSINGNDVMMGPNCYIHSQNHGFERTDILMLKQGYKVGKPIVIEDDVWWTGRDHHARTPYCPWQYHYSQLRFKKDFPEYSIVGGNPGKLIRNRKQSISVSQQTTSSMLMSESQCLINKNEE